MPERIDKMEKKQRSKTQLLYKMTDSNGRTKGGMQWGEGVTHTATGNKNKPLCTDAWIHAYESPLMAVFMNPIHAAFKDPCMFKASGKIVLRDGQFKVGCRRLKTVEELTVPVISIDQRVEIAILCAMENYKDSSFIKWANNWLARTDRSRSSASAAVVAASAFSSASASAFSSASADAAADASAAAFSSAVASAFSSASADAAADASAAAAAYASSASAYAAADAALAAAASAAIDVLFIIEKVLSKESYNE